MHPYFSQTTERKSKDIEYEKKILDCLKAEELTLTELADAMGYKGITKKMREAVDEMLEHGMLEWVAKEDRRARLHVK